jgi:hypothetical protein
MKGEKNRRQKLAEARENRKALGQVVAAMVAAAALCCVAFFTVPLGSPRQMVEAQVAHGEKIRPVAPTPSNNSGLNLATNRISAAATSTRVTGSEKYWPVSFAQLSAFPFIVTDEVADSNDDPEDASWKTRSQIPDSIKALSEKRVAITGFMLPVEVHDGLATDFLILKNQSACCYGVMPRINEWVIVRTAGQGVQPIMDVPVTAEGAFHVGDVRENGHLTGIYELDCDQLINSKD